MENRQIILFKKVLTKDNKTFTTFFANYTNKDGEQKSIKVKFPQSVITPSSPHAPTLHPEQYNEKVATMVSSKDFPLCVKLNDAKDYYVGTEKEPDGKQKINPKTNKPYRVMVITNVQSYTKAELENNTLDDIE